MNSQALDDHPLRVRTEDVAARGLALPWFAGHRRWAALLAILAVLLGGCRLEPQGAAEPTWPDSGDPSIAPVQARPKPTQPQGQQFGDTHTYPDGVRVRVCAIRTATLGMFPEASVENVQEGDPYTIISVRLKNDSQTHFEAAFLGRLLYGPNLNEAGTVNLDQATSARTAAAGEAITHDFGFLVPNEFKDDVVFELSIDIAQHPKAYFAGSTRTS